MTGPYLFRVVHYESSERVHYLPDDQDGGVHQDETSHTHTQLSIADHLE